MPVGMYRVDTDEQFLRAFSQRIARNYMLDALRQRRALRGELGDPEFHRQIMSIAPHRWAMDTMVCVDCQLPYEKFANCALANPDDVILCNKRRDIPPVSSALVDLLLARK